MRHRVNGAAALAAIALAGSALAASPERPSTPPANVAFCLPVHEGAETGAAQLRLAGAPLSESSGGGMLQSYVYRYLGGGAAGAASPPDVQATGARQWMSTPPPLIRLLLDGSGSLVGGRLREAQRDLKACMELAVHERNGLAEAACANNLAAAFALQGQLAAARPSLERALRIYQAPREPAEVHAAPLSLAGFGHFEELDISVGIERSTLNLGNLELAAGRLGEAEKFFRQAVDNRASNHPECRGASAADLAHLQGRLGQAPDSAAYASPSVVPQTRGKGKGKVMAGSTDKGRSDSPADPGAGGEDASMMEFGVVHLASARAKSSSPNAEPWRSPRDAGADRPAAGGEAWRSPRTSGPIQRPQRFELSSPVDGPGLAEAGNEPWRSPHAVASKAPPKEPAKALAEPTRPIAPIMPGQVSGGRFDDGALSRLLLEASREPTAPATPRTGEAWHRLALRAEAAGRPDVEFTARAALMRIHAEQGEAAAAAFHGKRAANLAQTGRAALDDRSPSRDGRRAFLRERRQVYVALAELLLDQQRLPEAESVLQLLKEDEGQQFIDGGPGATLGRLRLNAAEQSLQDQDERVARELRTAEDARVAVTARLPLGANALLTMNRTQVESLRVRLALALPGLAAKLRLAPLSRSPMADVTPVEEFLVGPGDRMATFVSHVIEDVAQFESPVTANERAQLADTQQRLRQIRAELQAVLRDGPVSEEQGVPVKSRPAGSARDEPDGNKTAREFALAEPLEGVWRAAREGDRIEAGQLGRRDELVLRAASVANSTPTDPREDTVALLARQPVATALLYYLPGDERLDVLLVTAKGRKQFRLAVTRTELDAAIEGFVSLLRETRRDPRPAAQAMYRRLFAPVEQAVANSGAQVLALSLADKLRFVPFAALHTGEGWLVERYAIALHPGGQLAGRLKAASPNWRAAAFGATLGSDEFSPLPSVRAEIASVVRRGDAAKGALPGDASLDQAFTAQRLQAALAGHAQVMHIASHFKFVGGDATASYLLLGDGSKLTLRELAGPAYRFDRTELVTLSACATGLSADDTYGQEVDGLAALLMRQGASSVLASLWEVNDESTATLMAALYRLREARKLSRALALREAQVAMIRSAAAAPGADAMQARGVSRINLPGDPEPDSSSPGIESPVSLGAGHPFYWAPFVLMGNWL